MLLFLAGMVLAVPVVIGALPDRYVVRFPEPLQKYGLPENDVALLPTAAFAADSATSLLQSDDNVTIQFATTETPEVTVTSAETLTAGASGSADEIDAATATIQAPPTVTTAPSPTVPPTETPLPIPAAARLDGFRHQFQTWNNCGPATLAMALSYFGQQVTQEQTAAVLKPDPEDRNVRPDELASYVNNETPYHALYRANGSLDSLRRFIANDMPVIVEIGIEPPGEFRWLGWYGHYLLLVAYDDEQETFWVYDSWFGTSEEPLTNANPDGREVSYSELAANWEQFNRNYIVLYTADQEALVESIIGQEGDDDIMWRQALERTRADLENQPKNAFYWFNLGTNYLALGQPDEAALAFDQARAIGLPWRMLWYQFGPYEAYLETERYEDVILLADSTLKDRPYFEESYYYKGLALMAEGDLDGAKQNLQLAADFNPNFLPAGEALAEFD
jgi:Peptidase_C39 like family/Tetratricopeptide repeat